MKLKYSTLLFLFLIGFTQSSWSASSSSASMQVDLELKIQEKIRSLVKPLDPHAQILVNVKIEDISTPLPAMNMDVYSLDAVSPTEGISMDDIEMVNIKIISRFKEFPPQLKQIINESVGITENKRKIVFEPFDEQTVQSIAEVDNRMAAPLLSFLDEAKKAAGNFSGPSFMVTVGALALIFLFGAVSLVLVLRMVHSTLMSSFNKLIVAIGEKESFGGQSSQNFIDVGPKAKALPSAKQGLLGDSNEQSQIAGLQPVSLCALIADCYWCEEDEYASWVWNQMSYPQRSMVLESLPFLATYVSWLSNVEPVKMHSFHRHPYYLKPESINQTSQHDVHATVQKTPSLWHALSPMRRSHLDLSVSERLSFQSSPPFVGALSGLMPESKPRGLTLSLDIKALTDKDDLAIMENVDLVPHEYRASFPTLAWLTFLTHQQREEIFSKLSAQDISRAWCGPQKLLKNLESAVGEKKMKLVASFVSRQMGERSSDSYKYLVESAIKLMDGNGQHSERHENENKHAA